MANKGRMDPSQRWASRIKRIRRYRERSDQTGMTRPPRDPDERTFLRETGQEGPYTEAPPRPVSTEG
jgi:hypothetical protein